MFIKKLFGICAHLLLVACLILFFGCNEPTTVGAGIVDNDVIDLQVEAFDVELSQRSGDVFTTYVAGGGFQINQAQCGILEDQIFGHSEAGFYIQFHTINRLLSNNPFRIIDSVRLVLYLDEEASYGPLGEVKIAIDQLNERIDGLQNYQSDSRFPATETLIEEFSFTPNYVMPPDSALEPGAHIRIPLPDQVGRDIFSLDSLIISSDSAFTENFYGFHIRPIAVSNHLAGFKPYRSIDQSVFSELRVFYKETLSDTTNSEFQIAATFNYFQSPVIQTYTHDYSGSKVEEVLNTGSDSLLFIQGNGGVHIDVHIDGLTELGNIAVNKAELFVPLNTDLVTYDDFAEVTTLFLTREGLNGIQEFLPEFRELSLFQFTPIGRVDSINGIPGYTYNIPLQAQELIDGTIFNEAMRLQNVSISTDANRRFVFGPGNMSEASARSVIFGQQNSSQAIRLLISYTDN